MPSRHVLFLFFVCSKTFDLASSAINAPSNAGIGCDNVAEGSRALDSDSNFTLRAAPAMVPTTGPIRSSAEQPAGASRQHKSVPVQGPVSFFDDDPDSSEKILFPPGLVLHILPEAYDGVDIGTPPTPDDVSRSREAREPISRVADRSGTEIGLGVFMAPPDAFRCIILQGRKIFTDHYCSSYYSALLSVTDMSRLADKRTGTKNVTG